ATDDILGAVVCWEDGVADPPAVARELVRRAQAGGVDVREGVDAREGEGDGLVVAAGPWSAELAELPIRPLCRQLVDTTPVADLPEDLPMVLEAETAFHFPRAGGGRRLGRTRPSPRG